MGKRDRRNSLKMRRRKAQVDKKDRAKRAKAAKTAPDAPGKTKKARPSKSFTPAPAAS